MLGYHNHFISTAHSEEDLETVILVAKEAFTTLKKNY
jgi:glutamate-1-semialdehyde aminotransferase